MNLNANFQFLFKKEYKQTICKETVKIEIIFNINVQITFASQNPYLNINKWNLKSIFANGIPHLSKVALFFNLYILYKRKRYHENFNGRFYENSKKKKPLIFVTSVKKNNLKEYFQLLLYNLKQILIPSIFYIFSVLVIHLVNNLINLWIYSTNIHLF